MRPVRLDLHGFAAFREATTISWDQVDYFALVGPTGSGKSTVIDAIVFALYGTAPRWGRSNAIRDALAPTGNRATVRLVFDLAGQRYVVAREVRRSGQSITQKTVSLERLADPEDLAGLSVVLADDPDGVRTAMERLIGLSYADFTQCVVLPQGQFADFLKATMRQRQDILVKLLGADRYEQIREAASRRALAAKARAESLTGQLDALAGATDEAIAAAQSRVAELDEGATSLEALASRWETVRQHADAAALELRQAQDHERLLSGLQVPEGLAEIVAAAAASAAAQAAADEQAAQARADHQQARALLDQAGERAPLAARLEQWQALEQVQVEQPAAAEDCERAEAEAAVAQQRLGDAVTDAQAAQQAWQRAASDLEACQGRTAELLQRQATLSEVREPEGLATLPAQVRAAQQRQQAARQAAAAADEAEEAARAAVETVADPARLHRALELVGQLDALRPRLDEARAHQELTAGHRGQAERLVQQTQDRLEQAEQELEQARTAEQAAALQAGLAPGCTCPVCGQEVTTCPEPTSDSHLAGALAARDQVRTAWAEASALLTDTSAQAAAADSTVHQLEQQQADLTAELAGLTDDPDPERLRASLEQVTGLEEAARQARTQARQSRAELVSAEQDLQAALGEQQQLRTEVQRAVQQLARLGLDPGDSDDLDEQWRELRRWRDEDLAQTTTELDASRRRTEQARAAATAAEQLATSRAAAQQEAQQAETDAKIAAARARDRLARLAEQQAGLEAALADGPSRTETTEALAELDRLQQAERECYQQAQAAEAEAERRAQARLAAGAQLDESRSRLQALLQAVASLTPPPIDTTDLAAGWQRLTGWAGERAAQLRQEVLPDLEQATGAAQAAQQEVTAELVTLAGRLRLPGQPTEPHRLELELTAERTRAESEQQALQEQAARRRRLEQERAQASEQQLVASNLADLLRANKFQGWLTGAALDSLVDGASETLRELSGGQFDLTHDKGEFFVIDHVDADSLRSVRTLSGGETFQASLALALTLSDQLSSLQTTGAAPLESIFLDEGFGSLDVDSLDIVAATLEKLAASDRMVGIVTHVAALAERVPVRYVVSRDGRGSHVAREEDR